MSKPTVTTARSNQPPVPGQTVRMSRIRKTISTRMTASLATSAQLTAVQEFDLTAVSALRSRVKPGFVAAHAASLGYLPFFARAVTQELVRFPELNASIDAAAGEVTFHDGIQLGVAVDTARGLMVPVVKDAHTLTVPELALAIGDLAERARSGALGPDDLVGSTFTITNIGSAGSLLDTPIINQPEVAILGTGAIRREPKARVNPESGIEEIVVRSVCFVPLTYDHRLIDGAVAGRFLSALRERLEGPQAPYADELSAYA